MSHELGVVGEGVEPRHPNAAPVGTPEALERLDRRRLAGTVRPEQGDHFPGIGVEAHLVDRRQAAEANLQTFELYGMHRREVIRGGERTRSGVPVREVAADLPSPPRGLEAVAEAANRRDEDGFGRVLLDA